MGDRLRGRDRLGEEGVLAVRLQDTAEGWDGFVMFVLEVFRCRGVGGEVRAGGEGDGISGAVGFPILSFAGESHLGRLRETLLRCLSRLGTRSESPAVCLLGSHALARIS